VSPADWRYKPDGLNGEPRLVTLIAPSISEWRGYADSDVAPDAVGPDPINYPEVGEVVWTGPRFLNLRWTGAAWEVVRYDLATGRFEVAVVIEPFVR